MQQVLDILILGRGGREEMLAKTLRRSARCGRLYAAFAEPGIEQTLLEPTDFKGVAAFCKERHPHILIIGPEFPIVNGLRDYLEEDPALADLKIIAPHKAAALFEGSKEYAKEFMTEEGIPTPRFMTVEEDTLEEGLAFLDSRQPPYVLKADGLAGGRGVHIIDDLAEAKDLLEDMVAGEYGSNSQKVLIEEFISGAECTITIATDGEDYLLLPDARDYKRHDDGDQGPNTPGMGAVSPSGMATDDFMSKVGKRIIQPTLAAMRQREIDYQGFLYFGIMSLEGEPLLIEYNARPGDPEMQAILPRIESDFVDVLEGIADRTIGLKRISVSPGYSVAVVGEDIDDPTERVSVVGEGATLEEARQRAYDKFEDLPDNLYYRKDIGEA